jgi:hypothetical protein
MQCDELNVLSNGEKAARVSFRREEIALHSLVYCTQKTGQMQAAIARAPSDNDGQKVVLSCQP